MTHFAGSSRPQITSGGKRSCSCMNEVLCCVVPCCVKKWCARWQMMWRSETESLGVAASGATPNKPNIGKTMQPKAHVSCIVLVYFTCCQWRKMFFPKQHGQPSFNYHIVNLVKQREHKSRFVLSNLRKQYGGGECAPGPAKLERVLDTLDHWQDWIGSMHVTPFANKLSIVNTTA